MSAGAQITGGTRRRTFQTLHLLSSALSMPQDRWQQHSAYCERLFETLQWVCFTRRDCLLNELKPHLESGSPLLSMLYNKVRFITRTLPCPSPHPSPQLLLRLAPAVLPVPVPTVIHQMWGGPS